jgi:hypothetical protein
MLTLTSERPRAGEHAPYYSRYIDLVPPGDVIAQLRSQLDATLATLRAVSAENSLRRYQAGKWSLREVIGHLGDTERIMAYRALRFARNDRTPLPGFEQDDYIVPGHFDQREWSGLLAEFEAVRHSTVALLTGLDPDAWTRSGEASGQEVTVRALAWVIAGHELHHMAIVREHYL